MRIGFLLNQVDNRGTGNAVLDYAHYNEKLLGNTSYILTFAEGVHNPIMFNTVTTRFKDRVRIFPDWPELDVIYHIKSGANEHFEITAKSYAPKYVVHAVFEKEVHGDVYATISPWMGSRFGLPWVPHIVQDIYPDPIDVATFRYSLDIPDYATVFGRLGGKDTFDIDFAIDAVIEDAYKNPKHHYIFVNTDFPRPPISNIHLLPELTTRYDKAVCIYASDFMIHARSRGETFGMSVGEFSVADRYVITYSESQEKAHLDLLGRGGIYYSDRISLAKILENPFLASKEFLPNTGYRLYTSAGYVMQTFRDVFL